MVGSASMSLYFEKGLMEICSWKTQGELSRLIDCPRTYDVYSSWLDDLASVYYKGFIAEKTDCLDVPLF